MSDRTYLDILRAEVLRWNKSFSLVSRQDPTGMTDELIEECVSAGEVLLDRLAQEGRSVHAIDLGTGGGFPGLIWCRMLQDHADLGDLDVRGGDLVEPRAKRAWFLERTGRLMGCDGLRVHEASWGSRMTPAPSPIDTDLVMISMKALAMTEEQVLEGLDRFAGGGCRSSLVVVRMVSSCEVSGLVSDLGLPVEPLEPDCTWGSAGHLVLPYVSRRPDSALLVSIHPA